MTMSVFFSEFLAKMGQWNYYKVKASGQMTSSNIKSTCESNGFVNTCVGAHWPHCHMHDPGCTVTALTANAKGPCDFPCIRGERS